MKSAILSVVWMLNDAAWVTLQIVQLYKEFSVFNLIMIVVWSILFGAHLTLLLDFIADYKKEKRNAWKTKV